MSARQANVATIAFELVGKGFDGKTVLDAVSFTVSEGEALCILGRSGTGKSVTLKLMIGLLKAVHWKSPGGGRRHGSSEGRWAHESPAQNGLSLPERGPL